MPYRLLLLGLVSVGGYVWLGYFVNRADFWVVMALYTGLFGVLCLLWHEVYRVRLEYFLGLGIVGRLALLGVSPPLSDDFYRFVWDGRWLAQGFNPYLIFPADYPQTELFSLLNSPQYYTVYPPLNQVLFAIGAWVFPENLWGHLVILRTEIILADVLSCWLLIKLLAWRKLPRQLSLLFFLNPLVISELTGNLHYEGVMMMFVLLSFYLLLVNRQIYWAGAALGMAAAVKLLPLVFLPLMWRRLGWEQRIGLSAVCLGVLGITFTPFLSGDLLQNVASSVNLYFQKFEFNASLYYLVRAIGYWFYGYNVIGWAGPGLSAGAAAGMLLIAFARRLDFFDAALLMLGLYFACATTVHPWYVCSLVALSGLTRHRFAVLWSALVPLSYHLYAQQPFHENPWLIALEYTLVGGWVLGEIVFSSKIASLFGNRQRQA
jgi:alpha-1,6-mannosyltransferase